MEQKPELSLKDLRTFGIVGSVFFVLVWAIQYIWHDRNWPFFWVLALIFCIFAFVSPRVLFFIYRPWMWVAEKIGAVVNRCILAIVFFGVVTPIGLVRRALGKDTLRLRLSRITKSHFEKKVTQPPEQFHDVF